MLITMVDGGIKSIDSGEWSYGGCETCDYGSNYTNEVTFVMANGTLKVEVSQMYEYALSQGDMMTIILPNVNAIEKMTEREFAGWLKDKLQERLNEALKACSYS